MGQRSQMYVRINRPNGKYYLCARYFQWNYGTRMVSRARGTLEWLLGMKDFYGHLEHYCKEKLSRIMEINFDYKDVVLSADILKEYADGYYSDPIDIFTGQDNNDGQFILDVNIQYEKEKNIFEVPAKFKYAFLNCCSENPMDGLGYMEWESDSLVNDWKKCYPKEVKYTERNSRYIDKRATLMTDAEVEAYINYDYTRDMGIAR